MGPDALDTLGELYSWHFDRAVDALCFYAPHLASETVRAGEGGAGKGTLAAVQGGQHQGALPGWCLPECQLPPTPRLLLALAGHRPR